MKLIKLFLFSLIIYPLLMGCGGQTSSERPLETLPVSEDNTPKLPLIPRSANQTHNEYFLEQFFQFCEDKSKILCYPFSLALDFRNIRSILSPKIDKWKHLSSEAFISTFNRWAENHGFLSHLYLKQNPDLRQASFIDPSYSWSQTNTEIVYIHIEDFSDNYSKNFAEQGMLKAREKGKLVVNLRNNTGGYQTNLEHLLSFFLPSKTAYAYLLTRQHLNHVNSSDYKNNWIATELEEIVQRLSPYWNTLTVPNHNFSIFNGKVAILINKQTFSSAEIFTYVLKTLKRNNVKVFGESSKGKVQNSVTIRADVLNAKLTYPIGELFTLQNTSLESTGVSVDETAYGESECLEKATAWLQSN